MRVFLNNKAATLAYKYMILPIMEYGDIFLSAASKLNRDQLQTLQNRALRSICRAERGCDTDELHTQVALQKLQFRRDQHLLLYMYSKKDNLSQVRANPTQAIKTRTST